MEEHIKDKVNIDTENNESADNSKVENTAAPETSEKEEIKNSKKTEKKSSKKEKKVSVSKLEQCQKELDASNEKVVDLSDKILRLNAEFENFRKRVIRERDDIRTNTRIDTVETIVPVLDHFELALNAAENAQNIDAVIEGMNMIKTEFEKVMSTLGVEVINAIGSEFDPNLHEAVANEPSDEFDRDIVSKQWRPGYKINNRLIRPATVVVSSGKAEE